MPWVSVEKKVIGTVELKEKAVPPPVVPPSPIIADFIEEHRKLKAIIDRHGKNGLCVARGTLETEGGIVGEQLDRHIRVFTGSDAASPITEEGEEVFCGKSAIKELKRKLEVEL